jgi:hypothetical protein
LIPLREAYREISLTVQLAAASHAVLRVQIQKSPHCTIKMASCPGAFAHCAPSQRVEEQPPLGSEVKLEKGKIIKTIMAQGERSEQIFWMLFLENEGFLSNF